MSSWGLWRRKHGEGEAWCGKGRGEGVPLRPPIGVQAAAPRTYPGHLPRDPFPGPGDPCVQCRVGDSRALPARDWPGNPRPRAGFIAGGRAGAPAARWGALGSALRVAPGTVGTRGRGGWEREQRTRGRMERRGAPWHRDTNARTGASGAETRTSERWGRRGRSGGDEAGMSLPRACLCTRSAERGARSSRC